MLLFKAGLALAFGGYVVASPQVVVTETDYVTVDPPSTSTITKVVTVTAKPTTSTTKRTTSKSSTITTKVVVTITKTVTATPTTTPCPLPLYYQCGGKEWDGCTQCRDSYATCYSANEFYAQCTDKTAVPTTTADSDNKRIRLH